MDRDLCRPRIASVYGCSVIWTGDRIQETRLNQFRPLRQVILSTTFPIARPAPFDDTGGFVEAVLTDDDIDSQAFACESRDSLAYEFGDCFTSL